MMQTGKPNLFVRFFSFLWRGLNALRKVLHFVLLLAVFWLILIVIIPETPTLPRKAALVLDLQGVLTEQLAGTPFDRAIDEMTGNAQAQTLVREVVDALEYAAQDDRIGVVYLRVDALASASISEMQTVADALVAFRESGKQVLAPGAFFSQQGYYLASFADEILLDPNGAVLLNGFGRFRNYFSEAIEKLSITWNVYKVGTHKSFVEPYTRNSMSDEDRENSGRLLNNLWSIYVERVEANRELESGTLQNLADNLDAEIAKDAGDFAATAMRLKLVDALATATDVRQRLIGMVGESESDESTFSQIRHDEYVDIKRLLKPKVEGDDVVAVVVASGSIIDGDAPPGQIGGDSTARLLREARTDDAVKAVVLRVDSGGGSAFASDVILQEIRNIQAAGKPVVASMGGVAASGGYWISMAADQIVAQPSTITGSIGIFGMFPTFERSLARLGVYTDGVGTARLSSALRLDVATTDQVDRILQLNIEHGYARFIGSVADYREMTTKAVDAVAQGKVWSGADALQFGLVDTLGDLDDALTVAAGLASLEDWDVRFIEPKLSAEEALLLNLLGGGAKLGISPTLLAPRPSQLDAWVGVAESELERLARFNDPGGVYAECFCEID